MNMHRAAILALMTALVAAGPGCGEVDRRSGNNGERIALSGTSNSQSGFRRAALSGTAGPQYPTDAPVTTPSPTVPTSYNEGSLAVSGVELDAEVSGNRGHQADPLPASATRVSAPLYTGDGLLTQAGFTHYDTSRSVQAALRGGDISYTMMDDVRGTGSPALYLVGPENGKDMMRKAAIAGAASRATGLDLVWVRTGQNMGSSDVSNIANRYGVIDGSQPFIMLSDGNSLLNDTAFSGRVRTNTRVTEGSDTFTSAGTLKGVVNSAVTYFKREVADYRTTQQPVLSMAGGNK